MARIKKSMNTSSSLNLLDEVFDIKPEKEIKESKPKSTKTVEKKLSKDKKTKEVSKKIPKEKKIIKEPTKSNKEKTTSISKQNINIEEHSKRKYTKKKIKEENTKNPETNIQPQLEHPSQGKAVPIYKGTFKYTSNWEPRDKVQLREANKFLKTNYKTWDELSLHPNLTKDTHFIDKYYDFLNWYIIGTKQTYNKEFFNKYKKRLYWINLM